MTSGRVGACSGVGVSVVSELGVHVAQQSPSLASNPVKAPCCLHGRTVRHCVAWIKYAEPDGNMASTVKPTEHVARGNGGMQHSVEITGLPTLMVSP